MDNYLGWLSQEPEEHEIANNKDGSQFIPIARVESLLDELTKGTWDTDQFQYSTLMYGTTLMISASIQLLVEYGQDDKGAGGVYRRLVGAVTFANMDYADNLDFAGTALSEAIKNAAKKLGPRFGKNLNGRGEIKETREGRKSIKLIPDQAIKAQYSAAIHNNRQNEIKNLESIYNFENAS